MPPEFGLLLFFAYFLPLGNFYPAAEYFRIRVRRFAQKVFIVRRNREKRRINTAERCGKGYVFVSAHIKFNRNGFEVQVLHGFFYCANRRIYFNHKYVFDKNHKKYAHPFRVRKINLKIVVVLVVLIFVFVVLKLVVLKVGQRIHVFGKEIVRFLFFLFAEFFHLFL